MADQQTVPPSDKKEEKKKGVINKLQEMTPDKEEQIALVGVAVRLASMQKSIQDSGQQSGQQSESLQQ